MKNFIGEACCLNNDTLIVNVLGNHLPKDNEGYNPCLEIVCKDRDTAWGWYCKAFKISVSEDKITKSKRNGFNEVNFEDCVLEEMTKDEVKIEVDKHRKRFE